MRTKTLGQILGVSAILATSIMLYKPVQTQQSTPQIKINHNMPNLYQHPSKTTSPYTTDSVIFFNLRYDIPLKVPGTEYNLPELFSNKGQT